MAQSTEIKETLALNVCQFLFNFFITESLSCKNQSIDLQSKSIDWFLYDRDLHHERVNATHVSIFYICMDCVNENIKNILTKRDLILHLHRIDMATFSLRLGQKKNWKA